MTEFARIEGKSKSTVSHVARGSSRGDRLRKRIEDFIFQFEPNLLHENEWYVESGPKKGRQGS